MNVKRPTRSYRMTARAEAVQRTGTRITDAMLRRFAELPYDQIRLEDVAEDAGVTVQTLVRRFGSKHGLLAATVQREQTRLAEERAEAMGHDPSITLRRLITYYEHYGLLILKLYAEAHQAPGVPEHAERARAYHVNWCRQAFADALRAIEEPSLRVRREAQIVALCDAHTWRILRFDGHLSMRQTESAIAELLLPLLSHKQ